MRTLRLQAVRIQVELVVVDGEAAVARDAILALLDLGVVELLDAAALQAHEVVVVLAFIELVYGLAALEVVAVRWRSGLCWKRSSTFRRGTVTLSPVLLSSLGSLMAGACLWREMIQNALI